MPDKKDYDDFWALERLLPKRSPAVIKGRPPQPRFADVVRPADADTAMTNETRLTFSADAPSSDTGEERTTYVPENNPFLLSVTVTQNRSAYSFYAMFKRDAHRLYTAEGPEVPYASFFSYIPQYSQLSPSQKTYYLYFRACVRRKTTVKTDLSYFMLLVYEILNLPDLLPPREGIEMLVYLWRTYRAQFPQVDKYLAAWLPDYCLMHQLPCPTESLSPILPEVLAAADFKEFYLGSAQTLTPEGIDSLVALASDYRYRYSRYAAGENAALFEGTMHRALLPVLEKLLREESLGVLAAAKRRENNAFAGSLCAHNMRCHLSVTYHPFEGTPRFRSVLTQAVKYVENRLRARLAVKSRLAVTGLPPEYKELINRFFEGEEGRTARKAAEEPAYLKLYAAESTGISFADATDIETSSWETTRRLLDEETPPASTACAEPCPPADAVAFAGAAETDEKTAPPSLDTATDEASAAPQSSDKKQADRNPSFTNEAISANTSAEAAVFDRYGLGDAAYAYLHLLHTRDLLSARAHLRACGENEGLIVEEINGAFYVAFGDTVLEECDTGYRIIPDYAEDVADFLTLGGRPALP